MRAGLVDEQVTVEMPGGNLAVRREKAGNLVQSGPARRVYRATLDLSDFGRNYDG
jgi:diaminopimelate epimerase